MSRTLALGADTPPQTFEATGIATSVTKGFNNRLYPEDSAAHEWYRFVLSFPPHLVRSYIARFELGVGCRVLDPFCGTGTTMLVALRLGRKSIGVEISEEYLHIAERRCHVLL